MICIISRLNAATSRRVALISHKSPGSFSLECQPLPLGSPLPQTFPEVSNLGEAGQLPLLGPPLPGSFHERHQAEALKPRTKNRGSWSKKTEREL